jgi:hypothetical protein
MVYLLFKSYYTWQVYQIQIQVRFVPCRFFNGIYKCITGIIDNDIHPSKTLMSLGTSSFTCSVLVSLLKLMYSYAQRTAFQPQLKS